VTSPITRWLAGVDPTLAYAWTVIVVLGQVVAAVAAAWAFIEVIKLRMHVADLEAEVEALKAKSQPKEEQ
jgi:hypothetical protein